MASVPRVLLSGFEPFGGSDVNCSQRVVERLADDPPAGVELITCVLPVVGSVGPRRLLGEIRRARPSAVLMLGESAAASAVTIEVVAINLRDYRIADNRGRTVRERPVVADGPAAYFATLPRQRLRRALLASGVPTVFSMSAGTFLCNEVMYAALHELRRREVPCGFVHLPRLPEQALGERGAPSMDLSLSLLGVRRMVEALARG